MAKNKRGRQTLVFNNAPRVISGASVVGDMEGEGPLKGSFDYVLGDDTWGEDSWEKAERKMFQSAALKALEKAGLTLRELDCLLGGDLLNQIITASFAARELASPFLGLYGACSTMAESLLVGAALISGGFFDSAACVATSHFSTAERQYRLPLEMGSQDTPTAQRTVTGAGAVILAGADYSNASPLMGVRIKAATVGKVIDLGINDQTNLGAAMAPAAADTLNAFLAETGRGIEDIDAVITGDLGSFGSKMFNSLMLDSGIRTKERHIDCGQLIFSSSQDVNCGGSGCGCSAAVLTAHILPRMSEGKLKNAFFMATGALLSPTASMQGETIPGVAHGIYFERESL